MRAIRGAIKRSNKETPGLDAGLATAALLWPALSTILMATGTGFIHAVVYSLIAAIGMFIGTPMLAAFIEAGGAKRGDSAAFVVTLLALTATTYSMVAALPAAITLVFGSSTYALLLRRNLARAQQRRAVPGLPEDVVERVAKLPKKLQPELREPVDEALAAFGSLVELIGDPAATPDAIDRDSLLTDAAACVREVVARTEAAMKLQSIATRTPEVDDAAESLASAIQTLVRSLTAAVGAAATYTAVGEAGAAQELAERAAYLHHLAEGRLEVDRALES